MSVVKLFQEVNQRFVRRIICTTISVLIMAEGTSYIPFGDVRPCIALGCCVGSIYNTSSPDFLGCVSRNTVCCIRNELLLCKPSRKPDACCNVIALDCDTIPPGTCYQTQTQVLCMDLRVAIPPDSLYAPCIFTLLGCTFFYKDNFTCKCCAKGNQL